MATLNGKRMGAHVAMCMLAHGERPSSTHYAAHSCGKGHLGCVNPRHVRWATPLENAMDRIEHGTSRRGEAHYGSKLTESGAREIRALRGIETQESLAKRFGISRTGVSGVQNGHSWSWLDQA